MAVTGPHLFLEKQMRSILAALLLALTMALPTAAAKPTPFINASPATASVNDYVDLTWGNLPKGRTVNLVVIDPSGDGSTVVLDMALNSSYPYPVNFAGTYEFQLVQGNKVLDSAFVEVS